MCRALFLCWTKLDVLDPGREVLIEEPLGVTP